MKISFYSEKRLLFRGGGPESPRQTESGLSSGLRQAIDGLSALIDYKNEPHNSPSRTRIVQGILKGLGYNLGTTGQNKDGIDGDYGTTTRAVVSALQNDLKKTFPNAGITVDGIFGPQTAIYTNKYVSFSQRKGLAEQVGTAPLSSPIVPSNPQTSIPTRSQKSGAETVRSTQQDARIESDISTERGVVATEAREQREKVVLNLSVIHKTNGQEIVDFIVNLAKRGHPHFKMQNNSVVLYFSQNKRIEFYGVPPHDHRAFLRIGNSIYFSQRTPNPYQLMHTGRNKEITKVTGMPERRYGKLGEKGVWIIPNVNDTIGYPVKVDENGDGTYRVANGRMDFDRSGFVITQRERERQQRQQRQQEEAAREQKRRSSMSSYEQLMDGIG